MAREAILIHLDLEQTLLATINSLLSASVATFTNASSRACNRIGTIAEQRRQFIYRTADKNFKARQSDGGFGEVDGTDPAYVMPLIMRDLEPRTHDSIKSILDELLPLLTDLQDTLNHVAVRAASIKESWDALGLDESDVSIHSDVSSQEDMELIEADQGGSGGLGENPTSNIILDMPPEILLEIILWASTEDINMAWSMGQVNQSIRRLILSSSTFWTRLDVNFPLRRNEIYLERSRDARIMVNASLAPLRQMNPGIERIAHFVDLVTRHSSRIQDLHMVYVMREWLEAALPLLKSAHNLHYLDIGLHNDTDERRPDSSRDEIPCKPRILRLRGPPVWNITDEFLSEVEHFEYIERYFSRWRTLIPLRTLTSYLRAMFKAQTINLSDIVFPEALKALRSAASAPDLATFTFTALTHVEFHRVEDYGLSALWASFVTPHLESLTMVSRTGSRGETEDDDNETHPSRTQPFIPRFVQKNPQLRHLDLSDLSLSDDEWATIFGSLLQLKHLRIAACGLSTSTLRPLIGAPLNHPQTAEAGPSGSHACPVLTHLVLENEMSLGSQIVRGIVSVREPEGISGRARLRRVVMRGFDADHVLEEDVLYLRSVVDDFILETYGATSEGSVDTDSTEDTSSDGLMSGDEWLVSCGGRI